MMFIASLIHVRPACEPDCDKSKRIEREFKRVEISHEVIHIFSPSRVIEFSLEMFPRIKV